MKVQYILTIFLFFCFSLSSLQAAEPIEDYSHEEALRLGERMYREGILPSGEPMKALVMGDIPFDGRMFTCDDCHQRSGLGSEEGTIISWPTNGKELYIPRRRTGAYRLPVTEADKQNPRRQLPKYYQMEDVRPAYTDKSLARVLRVGIDPAGRSLDPIMPKYRLKSTDMNIMIYYLKHLSVEVSPGVDEKTLQFATVIGGNVPEDQKSAMLDVLLANIDAHNIESRNEGRRATSGPFYKTEMHQAYRKLNLQIWELTGPEATWRKQLEDYYSRQPVFALLGGITEGSWEQIHDFSEEKLLPCLFPITDMPKISPTDWYTLYFSKGKYQEGESAAKFVRAQLGMDAKHKVVQVYRRGNSGSAMLAQGFAETWQKIGGAVVEELVLEDKQTVTDQVWGEIFDRQDPVVLLAWLDNSDKAAFTALDRHVSRAAMIFASATLLDRDFTAMTDGIRENILITYPYSLPSQDKVSRFAVQRWLQARKIPVNNFDIQAKMYFLGWMLPGSIKHMRSEFFRDYFLEGLDMMTDQDYAIAVYPRLTFGAGQRYASKGCYIVRLSRGENPELLPVSEWVIH